MSILASSSVSSRRFSRLPAPCLSVFVTVVDPVGAGFVAGMAHPGGKRDRLHQFRIWPEREMAGTVQGDRTRHDARRRAARSRLAEAERGSLPPSRRRRPRSGWNSVRSECMTQAKSNATSANSRAHRRRPDRGRAVRWRAIHRELIITLAARHRLPAIYSVRRLRHRRRPDVLRTRRGSISSGARPGTSTASSRARSRPTCRCRRR